jgi:hypothetical protein
LHEEQTESEIHAEDVQCASDASGPVDSDDDSSKRENKSGNTERAVQGTTKFLSLNRCDTKVKRKSWLNNGALTMAAYGILTSLKENWNPGRYEEMDMIHLASK